MSRRLRLVVFSFCLVWSGDRAAAGAFMLPDGAGQFIAGVGYYEGSRRFDGSGGLVPATTYRKAEASGYLEYGLTPWLTLVLAPAIAHADGSPGVSRLTGSDSSAVGARLELYGAPTRVLSLQVLFEPPLGIGPSGDGVAADVRLLAGQTFALGPWPAFVDAEAGVRFRSDPDPDEAKADLTIGVRPTLRTLFLLQDFNSIDVSSVPGLPRQAYSTLQASLVFDVSRSLSLQVGAFRAIAGREALLGEGPIVAIWDRF